MKIEFSCNIEAHRNDVTDDTDDEREDESANMILKNLRLSTKNKLLIAPLNINSIRSKLEALKCVVSRNIDILIIIIIIIKCRLHHGG